MSAGARSSSPSLKGSHDSRCALACFGENSPRGSFSRRYERRCVFIPGLFVAEHELEVPLDHARPDGETITVFAREIADPDGRDRPWLVYLQGGPGFESPRPIGNPRGPAWLDRALEEFRVLLLDQRGTGRSTPVTGHESVEYLTHFRADNIVRDCENLRTALSS